jgi:hypothetical protein
MKEPAGYFSKLTFSYKFKSEDGGHPISFAYAVPYSFSDLMSDFE